MHIHLVIVPAWELKFNIFKTRDSLKGSLLSFNWRDIWKHFWSIYVFQKKKISWFSALYHAPVHTHKWGCLAAVDNVFKVTAWRLATPSQVNKVSKSIHTILENIWEQPLIFLPCINHPNEWSWWVHCQRVNSESAGSLPHQLKLSYVLSP